MNTRYLAALFVAFLSSIWVAHAVKVDSPGQAESESTDIVTGTMVAIYGKVVRDASYEWNHCVGAVRVESVEKGSTVKPGELIYVRYISGTKWIGKGQMPPGPGGHENIPAEGEKRKICFSKNSDGGLDVYYVSGFQMPGKK